jgi:predicted RNase H-related nuclease YkuK (DUF458 family)
MFSDSKLKFFTLKNKRRYEMQMAQDFRFVKERTKIVKALFLSTCLLVKNVNNY